MGIYVLFDRFSVSPCKSSATTSPSRFTISPTAVTASANSTSQANSCRQLTSPSTNRFSVQAVETTSSTDPSSEVAEKQQQPRIETLDHPVKDSVVESSDGNRVSKEANQGAAACPTSSESGKRKPSRFKLSRVQWAFRQCLDPTFADCRHLIMHENCCAIIFLLRLKS